MDNKDMVEISVIMGVYNCKAPDLLRKSVCSIINQTFSNWEFIICDDGSLDNTYQILLEISKQDTRIKILHYEENHGLAYALNYCLKEAQGKYIARQDDDDVSACDRFEKQRNFLESNKEYDIVGCTADVYDSNGIWGEYYVVEKPQGKDFYWNSPFMHPTIMARREAFEAVNGYRVAKETNRCEDIDLFMRMYAEGFKGYNLQEKLYLYRFSKEQKQKYRAMKDRINEAVVKWQGYLKLRILFPKGILYVIKPIIVGLIPQLIMSKIKKRQYHKRRYIL